MKSFLGISVFCVVLFNTHFISAASRLQMPSPELTVYTKTPGNPAETFPVSCPEQGRVRADCGDLEVKMFRTDLKAGDGTRRQVYKLVVRAYRDVNFHLGMNFLLDDVSHSGADFLLPGLWYKRNMKVSPGAPSMSVSDSWMFREDRLSTPLVSVYDPESMDHYTLRHVGPLKNESLVSSQSGEVIMYGNSDLGSVGFGEMNRKTWLGCTYPVSESPKSYLRKLQLMRPVQIFRHLKKGEKIVLEYEMTAGNSPSYTDFVRKVWQYAYDSSGVSPVTPAYTKDEVKAHLAGYFRESYTDVYPLKGYSGVHVDIDLCEKRGIMEVGFIGRIFLNAYHALQYGEEKGDSLLVANARDIFDSYLKNGFTANGFIREKVDFRNDVEQEELSIRRQSEGVMALMYYLAYEKSKGRSHPEWEEKIVTLLDKIMALQRKDYSFPRKFYNNMRIADDTGGSSSCAILPLTMAYHYFNDPRYLSVAENTAVYVKKESIDKGDYFSSTLDARCEDKEASIYITTAYYYLWLATGKKEYVDDASKSVYFSLSYYYTWDVPFAKGQMLGDLGFKTRGWGNVSVENNHVDVYVFEFLDVLKWLSGQTGDNRLDRFCKVIASGMQDQLLPVEGRLCGIAKPGYYPEVVQHTNWDYGFNGKGYYNRLFGPGWVVASLWTMLSPENTEKYFNSRLALKE